MQEEKVNQAVQDGQHQPSEPPHDRRHKEIHRLVREEQVALAYRINRFSAFIALVPIVVVWWIYHPFHPGLRSNGWLVAGFVAVAMRLLVVHLYKKRRGKPGSVEVWSRLFSLCMFAAGLVWGYAGVALLPLGHPIQQAVLMIIIPGLAASALPYVMPHRWTYAAFLMAAMAPLVAYLFYLGSPEQILVGVLMICYMGFMFRSSIGIGRNVSENLVSRFRQAFMAEEVAEVNRRLREEIIERRRAEEALRKREALFRAVVEKSSEVLVLTDPNDKISYISPSVVENLKCSPEDLVSTDIRGLVHQEDLDHFAGLMSRVRRRPGEVINATVRLRRGDGVLRWVDATARNLLSDPDVGAVVSNIRDVTKRKEAQDALRWKTTFLEALVESSQDGILVLDTRSQRVAQNRRFVEIWKMPDDVAQAEDEGARISFLMASLKNPKEFHKKVMHLYQHPDDSARVQLELRDGIVIEASSYPVLSKDSMEQYGRIWMFRDITEIRRYWSMLEELSTTDGLTGISNRRRFDEHMERGWRRAMRESSQLSLLLVDIDYFKQFNDRYGHLSGDDCLVKVAAVLGKIVRRGGDLVARYGGEEFACVLSRTGEKGALRMARRIADAIAGLNIPHEKSNAAKCVTVSIGVATEVPDRGQEYSELIRRADRSLYAAKRQGRNRVVALSNDCHGEGKSDDGQPPSFSIA